MTTNLYGYSVETSGVIGANWEGSPNKSKSKPMSMTTDYEDSTPYTKPKPPKVIIKEFDKKLVSSELNREKDKLKELKVRISTIVELMSQEDADDVYGISEVDSFVDLLIKEWNKSIECLNKELELSLPT